MYGIASNLRGFSRSTLRVCVTELRDGYAWVVTADLADAGTALVLDASQVRLEADMVDWEVRHCEGLVAIG